MNSSIYLGGGCFWCIESVFKKVNGITFTSPGYMGGKSDNPTYEEVCEGYTNHVEVVELQYDQTIDLNQILNIFFTVHDPTSINRQGADVGTQYRSIILFHDDEQKKLSEETLKKLDESGAWNSPIVTKIEKFEKFYPAENYHQNYYELNPNNSYCSYVISPKIDKFKKAFSDILKN